MIPASSLVIVCECLLEDDVPYDILMTKALGAPMATSGQWAQRAPRECPRAGTQNLFAEAP